MEVILKSEFAEAEQDKLLAERIKDQQCRKRLPTWEDAEDATQETFLSFWETIHYWNSEGNVRGWLCGIAKRVALGMHRHRSRKKRSAEMVYIDEVDADGNQFQLADPRAEYQIDTDKECEIEIDKALLQMKPKFRLAWVLYNREGYVLREVAEIMGGKSASHADYWVRQANAFIKRTLRSFYEELTTDPDAIDKRANLRKLFR